jgi:xylan 1,4-beta-xylosidase
VLPEGIPLLAIEAGVALGWVSRRVGLLNLHGIAKPVYQAFQLLHRVGYELLPVSGTHDTVSAWVTCRGKSVTVLLTNYAMPHHSITAERVRVRSRDALKPRTA